MIAYSYNLIKFLLYIKYCQLPGLHQHFGSSQHACQGLLVLFFFSSLWPIPGTSSFIAKQVMKLQIPLLTRCCYYKGMPPHPGSLVLGIKPKALCMLGKHSAN